MHELVYSNTHMLSTVRGDDTNEAERAVAKGARNAMKPSLTVICAKREALNASIRTGI